jgi:hypothetical protein
VDSDKFYRDTFAPFCSAGGIALIAAGNGYEIRGVDQGRDVANPYGKGAGQQLSFVAHCNKSVLLS